MSRGCRIYIGNLPPDCRWIITQLEVDFKFLSLLFSREKDLDRFFKGYGRKTDVLIKQVKYLRRSRNWVTNFPFNYDQMFYKTKNWTILYDSSQGFGFVEFEDYRDADDAVYELNGKDLLGERWVLFFSPATPF